MAKVAFVSQPRDPVAADGSQQGSVATVLWELATRIANRYETMVFAPRAPGQPAQESYRSGLDICRVPAWRSLHKALDLGTAILGWRSPYFASPAYFREYGLAVARALERYQPDIVHLQNNSHFLPLFRRAVPRARLIMQVHDELHSLLPAGLVRARLQELTAIVTPSRFVTHRLEGRLSYMAGRIHTIGNGVDAATFRPAKREAPAVPCSLRILYVGRVSPEKGVHILAEAFTRLCGSGDPCELEIAGPVGLLPLNQLQLLGRDPQVAALLPFYGRGLRESIDRQLLHARSGYRRFIESLLAGEPHGRIRFLGHLPRDALIGVYQRADALVIPSLCEEPFGLPVAEGMACGLACVGSHAGGIPELIVPEETGLLVERGDAAALADALRRLARDPAERERLGRSAREGAERLFDWSIPAARLDALYQGALAATTSNPTSDLPAAVLCSSPVPPAAEWECGVEEFGRAMVPSRVLQWTRLQELAAASATDYRHAKPFPHRVLDGLFAEDLLDRAVAELPTVARWAEYDSAHERKVVCSDVRAFGPAAETLVHALNSAPFVRFLERLTGIHGLIPDPHLHAAGYMKVPPGGFLGLHYDFSTQQELRLDRRVNVLLYLNRGWRHEWGGQLELHSNEPPESPRHTAVEIEPLFNRLAIFNTPAALHGHRRPVACPPERARLCLSWYYYTAPPVPAWALRVRKVTFPGSRRDPATLVIKAMNLLTPPIVLVLARAAVTAWRRARGRAAGP